MNDSKRTCLSALLAVALLAIMPASVAAEDSPEATMTSARLQQAVSTYATRVGARCYSKGAPEKLTVQAAAKPMANRFEVEIDNGNSEFQKCFKEEMRRDLRDHFKVARQVLSGEGEYYVPIVASAKATHTFTVEKPAATPIEIVRSSAGPEDDPKPMPTQPVPVPAENAKPTMTSARLQKLVARAALPAGANCYSKGAPENLTVKVAAKPKTQRFEIRVDKGTSEFQECFKEQMRWDLGSSFRFGRIEPSGASVYYFRIDASAQASHTFTVEKPNFDCIPPWECTIPPDF